MIERICAGALALLVCGVGLCCGASARAADDCDTHVVRANLVRCALSASYAMQRARHGIEVQQARKRAVSPWLPSNPALALSGGHRKAMGSLSGGAQATNWYATLSQEVEIAGQRSARRDAAGAAASAQTYGSAGTAREVSAGAWRAYFEALAAREAVETALRLERAFAHISEAAQAAAARGLLSGVDADVAELTVVKLSHTRIEAQRRWDAALATLSSLLGRDPAGAASIGPSVEGELTPLTNASALSNELLNEAVEQRPELGEARAMRESYEHSATALRRARVPNLTFSVFAQRDGFDERVLGGGVSLPIPLPAPLGRTHAGEIAEQHALARQASAALDGSRRQVRLEVALAQQAFETAKAQAALYSADRLARAERGLTSIAAELGAGRLAVSSAVLAQQTLIDFLRAQIEAKLALCLSSVELARAAALPLEGDAL